MKPISDPVQKNEVVNAYLRYFEAYTRRNWDEMCMVFSRHITMFGTGPDETAPLPEMVESLFRREFQQAPCEIEYTIKETHAFSLSSDSVLLMLVMDMKYRCNEQLIESNGNRTTAIMV